MRSIVRYLLLFLAWNLLVSLILALSIRLGAAAVGVPLMVAIYLWLIWWLVPREAVSRERRALLRLRPLGKDSLRWTILAVPVLLVLSWAVGEVYVRLVPVPPETFNPFGDLLAAPGGRLAITVLAVGMAPVIEEFFFRGFIQRQLERRFGARAGIGIAAAIFGAVHVLPWVFPLHFFLGLAFGYVVWATRSIWAGVILHAANNVVAMVGLALRGEEVTATPTLWQMGPDTDWWITVLVLLLSGGAAVLVARGMRKAGRERSLRPSAAAG